MRSSPTSPLALPQVTALRSINASLPRIYRTLTGAPSGDAHCAFSEAQLFEEGVGLVVRPPGQRWRAFGALSGGQQALAALALSFSLQVSGLLGVGWVVRPPGPRWRAIGAIRGGQQALAALTLSFSLQVGGG